MTHSISNLARLGGGLALCLGLLACAPDPKLIEAGLMPAPEPKLIAGVYEGKTDNGFTVPTVPVEKVPAAFQRQTVYYPTTEVAGTVIINPAEKFLYLVTGENQATRYGIAVGRAGFEWSGTALITSRQNWPTWTPPPEMIERKPELVKWEKGQPGGPDNPLGARALYLTTNGVDYGYRIHGTPEWFSIGKNASSGCIRMINQDVMDLHDKVQDGAKVVVLNADGSYPTKLTIPPPAPKPKAATVSVKAVPAQDDAGPMVLNPALTTATQPATCAVALVAGQCPIPALKPLSAPNLTAGAAVSRAATTPAVAQ